MDPASHRTRPAAFEDGLGKRYHVVGPGGDPLEVLALRPELIAVAPFEPALRERVSELAGFEHSCYARIRGVQRLEQAVPTIAVVADRIPGTRLSEMLALAEQQLLPLQSAGALCLIRQLVTSIAVLHDRMPGVCHGAISPERIVVTPDARLVVVDHVFGSALETLRFPHERYWKELRIAVPKTVDVPHFDQRVDVMQLGLVALALILGRPLGQEYPDRSTLLAESAWGLTPTGGLEPLPAAVRTWLARVLQLDSHQSFPSAGVARAELDRALGANNTQAPIEALKSFLVEYERHVAAAKLAAAVPATSIDPPAPAAPEPAMETQVTQPAVPPPDAPDVRLTWKASTPEQTAETEVDEEPDGDESIERTSWWRSRWAAAAAALVVIACTGAAAGHWYTTPVVEAEGPGTLVVNTNPAGAAVAVDGQPRGVTPLTLSLPSGAHVLEVLIEGEPRKIPLKITAGGVVSHQIELPRTAPQAQMGQLQVRTTPDGARVTVDGLLRGVSPLTVEELAPGAHTVELANNLGSVTHEVAVHPGVTASLVVAMTTTPQNVPVSGWISVKAPVDVQVFENQRLLGTSQSDRIMVSAGRHNLEIVSETLGYRVASVVNVSPGQTTPVRLVWPQGSIALNALPWADVWIDGQRVGETPIGNLAVPIGPHEVVFRHPELGERVVGTTVTLRGPARLSVDLRK
jgi:hypothetical protein